MASRDIREKLRVVYSSRQTKRLLGAAGVAVHQALTLVEGRGPLGDVLLSGQTRENIHPFITLSQEWHSALVDGGYYRPPVHQERH